MTLVPFVVHIRGPLYPVRIPVRNLPLFFCENVMQGFRLDATSVELLRCAGGENQDTPVTLPSDKIRNIIQEIIMERNWFFASSTWGKSRVDHVEQETTRWEIVKGRLIDPKYTREEQTFESWNVRVSQSPDLGPSAEALATTCQSQNRHENTSSAPRQSEPNDDQPSENIPLVSLKLDWSTSELHVVRSVLSYVWEGYSEGNVVQTRETTKWVQELVGTVDLSLYGHELTLRDELISRVFHAVVGVSRLPLTSIESPLPGFTFGQLGYVARKPLSDSQEQPLSNWKQLLESGLTRELNWQEVVRLLELLLRLEARVRDPELVRTFLQRWKTLRYSNVELPELLRQVVNVTSLSPYTNFVENLLHFTRCLADDPEGISTEDHVDFLGYVLRQLGRHLTAYDLVVFHNRGANYPDALFLDAVLSEYLRLIGNHPTLFSDSSDDDARTQRTKRLRRRALRQGFLHWHKYRGLPVPVAPTSPGENTRVLPVPYVRVPEDQLLQLTAREKRLFENRELTIPRHATDVVFQCFRDLSHPRELQELGTAVFIDRPLGIRKAPGEPDQTVLFSHVAFSGSIAEQRLAFLAELSPEVKPGELSVSLPKGISVRAYAAIPPRVVSLADAVRAADDFLLLHTTRSAVAEFVDQYPALPWSLTQTNPKTPQKLLILPDPETLSSDAIQLVVYDRNLQEVFRTEADLSAGYIGVGGKEFPRNGLRLLRKQK